MGQPSRAASQRSQPRMSQPRSAVYGLGLQRAGLIPSDFYEGMESPGNSFRAPKRQYSLAISTNPPRWHPPL